MDCHAQSTEVIRTVKRKKSKTHKMVNMFKMEFCECKLHESKEANSPKNIELCMEENEKLLSQPLTIQGFNSYKIF